MATLVQTHTETMTDSSSNPSQAASLPQSSQQPATQPQPQESKAPLTWQTVPKEIKELFIERVIRPADLKNVCLVNHELHEIAVRHLYRNVALDLGSPSDTRLSSFLNPRNIGLKHIRQLRLYLATVYDKCNQEQQAQFATRMLLEFLPEDVLEEFSWCPWRPFSADNLMLLYRKQRKMKWLEVMDLDKNILPDLKKDTRLTSTMFQNTKKLALYPENRETLGLSGFFVEKTKEQLEELIVHCNFASLGDRERETLGNRELNDSATGPGLVSSTIFSCMMPFDKCEPFKKLKSLRLHRISLRYCADTWCKFVNFHDLQYLRIYHCTGADTLFGQLSKAAHLPKQLKVLEFQHRDNAENEALLALDGFLCLVSGIRDLVIDLENVKTLPASAGIARHAKTLELLNVHCTQDSSHSTAITSPDCDGDELVWDLDDFEKICKACKGLEQLSCAWPATSLIRSPSDEWKTFENSYAHLRKLVTLHITTWPNNKPSTQLLPRQIYETMLQALAQRAFELATGTHTASLPPLPPPPPPPGSDDEGDAAPDGFDWEYPGAAKLRLIAFGTSDKIYEREDSKNQIIYLRSSCIDAEGKPKVWAAPVGWCLRQFVEPRSEVLDFVLHQSDRHNKPPCRDMQETSRWGDDDEDIDEI